MILTCFNCQTRVKAEELAHYINEITDHEYYQTNFYEDIVRTFEKYSFFKCPSCLKPLVTCLLYDNDVTDPSEELLILYPKLDKVIDSSISISIRRAFNEALVCLQSRAFTACVIMCRKAVEGICKEQGFEKGNLKDKLMLMKEQAIIDPNLFEWADALRLYGNDAAHDLEINFTMDDAKDVIDFTYAIIEYIFVYRKKFQSFIERKNEHSSLKKSIPTFIPVPKKLSTTDSKSEDSNIKKDD